LSSIVYAAAEALHCKKYSQKNEFAIKVASSLRRFKTDRVKAFDVLVILSSEENLKFSGIEGGL